MAESRDQRGGRETEWRSGSPAFRAGVAELIRVMAGYAPLAESTCEALAAICRPRALRRGEVWVALGSRPRTVGFLVEGLMRAYAMTEDGREYTKIYFTEGMMPAAVVALLTGEPTRIALDALEDCRLIEYDHDGYRALLDSSPDLLRYHCRYLEENWILAKEPREVELAQRTAGERYAAFVEERPDLEERLTLQQIATHLGITSTQLSRIRRERKNS